MAKIIGITSSQDEKNVLTLGKMYIKAIENAGGIPLVLPVIHDNVNLIEEMIGQVDGILLSGGVDVDPLLFDEEPVPGLGRIDPERDVFELELARLALNKDKPILGICRGCQVLNVAAGGTIIQDIPSFCGDDKFFKHQQSAPRWHVTHTVDLIEHNRLAEIFGTTLLTVNSYHHQAVKQVADGFVATAHSRDGIIEAIEGVKSRYAVGVQWHPELLWEHHPHFTKIFKSLVDICQ